MSSESRFKKSESGYIVDSTTNLEWAIGPDSDTNYADAEAFIKSLGSDWRFPTIEELKELYQEGVGDRNIDPAFSPFSGWFVWCSPRGSSSAWHFDFYDSHEGWGSQDDSSYSRVFAVMEEESYEVFELQAKQEEDTAP